MLQFSVQSNHLHMIIEADSRAALSRGLQGLAIRLAKGINQTLGRRGRVWGERYHARALSSPRTVRRALVYVLMNFRKHGHTGAAIDPCSSAPWFTGWREARAAVGIGPPPVALARTWLARNGWQRHGLIGTDELPKGAF